MSRLSDILITIKENNNLTKEQFVEKFLTDCQMTRSEAEEWADMAMNWLASNITTNSSAPKNNTEPEHETKRIIEPEMQNMTLEDVKDINDQDPHIVKWKGNTVPRDQYTSVIDPNQPYDERHDKDHEFISDL